MVFSKPGKEAHSDLLAQNQLYNNLSMKQSKLFLSGLIVVALLGSCAQKSGDDTAGDTAKNDAAPSTATHGDATHGQQVYTTTCSPCHGTGGKGDGPAAATLNPKPADHTNKDLIGARTDQDLANIIKMGGGVVGKPTMPASPQLSETDVADVVAFLRQLSGSEHH
jgi:mono/diheme cytochrome c family protein